MYSYSQEEFVGAKAGLDAAVIVPVFNEAQNIRPLVQALTAVLEGMDFEILFVDDGSTDGSQSIVEELAIEDRRIRLIRRIGRRGLASAVTEGFLATLAPVVAVIDGDMQHDERILPKLISEVAIGGAGLAVGTRYANGGSVGAWAQGRQNISRFATRIASTIMKTQLSDPMSGFFAIRRDLFFAVAPGLSQTGYKLLLDIVASHKEPIKTAEVPYTFRTRTAGESKLDGAVVLEYGELLLEKLVGRILPVKLIMFGAIGLLGALVHMSLLWVALSAASLAFPIAQGLATFGAMTFNFTLNNALTYRDRMLTGFKWVTGLASFCAACSLGAVANIGIGTLLFTESWSWWISGLAGAAIGSVWNYAATSWLTWRRR